MKVIVSLLFVRISLNCVWKGLIDKNACNGLPMSHYLRLLWSKSLTHIWVINTLRPRRNEQHFADDVFKCIFFNENVWISIKISLKFVPKGPINNIPALVQIMAWRRSGDKPLSEPMMVSLPTHICVTRPQWVKSWFVTIILRWRRIWFLSWTCVSARILHYVPNEYTHRSTLQIVCAMMIYSNEIFADAMYHSTDTGAIMEVEMVIFQILPAIHIYLCFNAPGHSYMLLLQFISIVLSINRPSYQCRFFFFWHSPETPFANIDHFQSQQA